MCIDGQALSAAIQCSGNVPLNRDSDICAPSANIHQGGRRKFQIDHLRCHVFFDEEIDTHPDLNSKDIVRCA